METVGSQQKVWAEFFMENFYGVINFGAFAQSFVINAQKLRVLIYYCIKIADPYVSIKVILFQQIVFIQQNCGKLDDRVFVQILPGSLYFKK